MISQSEFEAARKRTLGYFAIAGIVLTKHESQRIEVADFGLGELGKFGLELITYINTERCCAKELVLFPGQTCPEHRHPPINGESGKEETFRCRWGTVTLWVDGEPSSTQREEIAVQNPSAFTVFHKVVLEPGDQFTIQPNTKHWFQGGSQGAVVSEFSTRSRDEADIFTDMRIVRAPVVGT